MLSNMHFLAAQRPGRSLCRSVPCLTSVSSVSGGAMAGVMDKLKGGEEARTKRSRVPAARMGAPGGALSSSSTPQLCAGRLHRNHVGR